MNSLKGLRPLEADVEADDEKDERCESSGLCLGIKFCAHNADVKPILEKASTLSSDVSAGFSSLFLV